MTNSSSLRRQMTLLFCLIMIHLILSPNITEPKASAHSRDNPQPPPTPKIQYDLPPGFSDSVLFQSDNDGDSELYLLTTSGLEQLTDNSYEENYAVFSPDGKKILYEISQEKRGVTYMMDLSSREIERVIPRKGHFFQPCWKPDGRSLAIATDFWGGNELAEYDLENKTLTRLTDTRGENILPAWSPDGRSIAFTGKRLIGWRVYILDLVTQKITRIGEQGSCRPDWSPDGKWIAYVSRKKGSLHDIFLMRPDGSQSRSLSKDPEHSDYYPSWSKDGKRIYFSKKMNGVWRLWVVNIAGGSTFQITRGRGNATRPDIH